MLSIDSDGDGTADANLNLEGSFYGDFLVTPSDLSSDAPTEISFVPQLPTISISALDANKPEGDSGTTPFTFEITRTGNLSGESTISYAVSGSGLMPTDWQDFSGASIGTVAFATGESSKTISINVTNDLQSELEESFTVSLSNPINGTIDTTNAEGVISNPGMFSYREYLL